MSNNPKISPNDTYVIDEDLLSEVDNIELTGLLGELTDYAASVGADEELSVDDVDGDGDEQQPTSESDRLSE